MPLISIKTTSREDKDTSRRPEVGDHRKPLIWLVERGEKGQRGGGGGRRRRRKDGREEGKEKRGGWSRDLSTRLICIIVSEQTADRMQMKVGRR